MGEKQTILLGKVEVVIDPDRLYFNEKTLSEFFEKEGGYYDYYGARLADAEYLMQTRELEYDTIYAERFKENKENNGFSDKMAEAATKADPDVESAKKEYLTVKHKVRLLQQHLRAWDRAHENAQSRGHFFRKEMDKLNPQIYGKTDNYFERQLDNVIKEVDSSDIDKIFQNDQS